MRRSDLDPRHATRPRGLCRLCLSIALGSAVPTALAQEAELSGEVQNVAGEPIARARISFEALDLAAPGSAGHKGRYKLAHQRQLAQTRLPVTVTDRDGHWRVLLTPAQAALTTSDSLRFVMRVRAEGYGVWQRAVGTDLRDSTSDTVVLEKVAPHDRLELTLRGGEPPYLGFALIERPFRVAGNRAIWLQEVLPLPAGGKLRFDEPPRIPGESPPTLPTAREEAYRITILAADLEALTVMRPAGQWTLELEQSAWPRRKILAERAEPARPPFHATFSIDGRARTIELDEPRVPMLGNEAPVSVTTGSGPVAMDTWDPDLPLFVEEEAAAAATRAASDAARGAELDTGGRIELSVVDREKKPVFGAGVFLEDSCVKRAAPTADVFGLSDARGKVELSGLPRGTYRVLVYHPTAGSREALAAVGTEARPLAVRLVPPRDGGEKLPPLFGTILLDVSAAAERAAEDPVEVGIVTPGGAVVVRRFEPAPRIVRLEGLVVGPCTFVLKAGDTTPVLCGGALAKPLRGATVLRPLELEPRRFQLRIVDEKGQPAGQPVVSLGDAAGPRGPWSARMFELAPGTEPGTVAFTVRLAGEAWVRVQDEKGGSKDLALSVDKAGQVIDVTLDPPPADATIRDEGGAGAPGPGGRKKGEVPAKGPGKGEGG